MRSWQRTVLNLLRRITDYRLRFGYWWKRQSGLGTRAPIAVDTYKGYGTTEKIFLQGRVLKYRSIITTATDSSWRSFVNNFKRFYSKEIMGAQLNVEVGENNFELQTDSEGFFTLDATLLNPISQINESTWFPAQISLKHTPWKKVDIHASCQILIPNPAATFGIISDIDDTILKTELSSILKLKAIYHTFFKNAEKRQTFSEVAAFYQALQYGKSNHPSNPVFYVSNSPWNLYDLLEDFLTINDLPKGPIILRDFGIPAEIPPKHYKGHKHENILKILDTYPNLPFVLIGDSGEKDTQIYLSIADAYPSRIVAIYIRDVNSKRKAKRTTKLIRNSLDKNTLLIRNFREAALHAALKGLLDFDAFERLTYKG